MMRRATFPYVRHDREDFQHQHPQQFFMQHSHHPQMCNSARPDVVYAEPMDGHYLEHDPNIKLEDGSPVMVPTQTSPTYFRSPNSGGLSPHFGMVPPGSLSYLSPGLPVQHTDDAASKETQYLRRRCFNCHTTEPPSWRRSTLNPGKIVCNKCGLYERTHLRPRPLRFDELRAGNKARKHAKAPSPKVKKEPGAPALLRRSSVSSNSSASAGANSDWDDNLSVYSSGSAPTTSFNSPSISSFPLSRDSQSPPAEQTSFPSGIRLPNNPLAELQNSHNGSPQHSPHLLHMSLSGSPRMSPPRKANSMPYAGQQQWHQSPLVPSLHLHEDMMVTPGAASLDEKDSLMKVPEEIGVGA